MENEMNILLLIGIGIFFGLGGGKIFQKLKIPQVVGYIIIGVLLGDSVLGLFQHNIIEKLTPINSFALGVIGFMIGGELKLEMFRKYGKKFITILLWEGLATFILVTGAITLYTGKLYIGILFGALASATAPAATVDVLWEYKSKGILTTTILALVALDDGLALILYGFSSAFAKTLLTGDSFSFMNGVMLPLKDIGFALLLGCAVGYLLYRILLNITDKDHFLVLAIGAILVNTGLAALFDLDTILANMSMGVILANQSRRISKMIFDAVKSFTPPIYVLFFVLVGARLQIGLLPKMGAIGMIYVLVRTFGKVSGSYIGAVVTKSESVVRKYLGITLFSQAGIAIGLAIAIYQSFSVLGPEGERVGLLVINVIAATTFLVQIIGPPCVKIGIEKAGEIGKDISNEDILNTYTVNQVMENNVETIHTSQKLSDVIGIIKKSFHAHFPIVNRDKGFLGVISFQNIKDIMFEKELGNLIVAGDIIPDDVLTVFPGDSLKSAMDKFMLETISFLPVLESADSDKFVGILHKRKAVALLKREMIGKLTSSLPSVSSGFRLEELLVKKNVIMELVAQEKQGAIIEMVNFAGTLIRGKERVIELLNERESSMTTGIGNGIAIPHIRTDIVSEIVLIFGKSKDGVEYNALDNSPVYLIFMIISPQKIGDRILKIMGGISKLLRKEEFRESLKASETAEALIDVIKEYEAKQVAEMTISGD